MKYSEVLENAKKNIEACQACAECNGRCCAGKIPGPGDKGIGHTFARNYDKWKEIRLNLDTIRPSADISTSFELFGKRFEYPFFAGPVGDVSRHYGSKYDDASYNEIIVSSCAQSGIAAFTGDALNGQIFINAAKIISENGGVGVLTIKPWDMQTVFEKLKIANESGAFASAMDIDAAGLPFLKGQNPPAGSKSVEELREIIKRANMPFIIKGIMTVKGALKAIDAGASAIVVSNHGGRVLDSCPATAEVLEEIAHAVRGRAKILVDGGIRSGADVFKALALGADACIMCRPFVTAVYGGEGEGVRAYIDKIGSELKDTMTMCGAADLSEITRDCCR